jgi:hypothetical protein
MGQISKPDANPIVLAVLNLILWGGVGYFLMGQQKKAIASIVYFFVGMMCFGIGFIIPLLTAYDAYLLGQKLANGETIEDNECGLGFLSSLPGFS